MQRSTKFFSWIFTVFANTTNSNWLNLEYKKLRYTICISECTYQLCCTWPEEWEPPFHTGWSCLSGPPWEPGWSLWWQCGTAGVVVPRWRWDWLPHGFQAAWTPGLGKLAEPIFWQDKNNSSFHICYIYHLASQHVISLASKLHNVFKNWIRLSLNFRSSIVL